ncbi:hypothetical protein NQZ68_020314 [Dissostichus eleginoides]|nr:hypothetical protein NQZ68_020314 [Dissostichus eleginoides]
MAWRLSYSIAEKHGQFWSMFATGYLEISPGDFRTTSKRKTTAERDLLLQQVLTVVIKTVIEVLCLSLVCSRL